MSKNITSDVAIKAVKVRSQPPPEKRSSVSRRLSRQESTRSNSGSEIFYGDSPVSIPFRWESTPGTPKVDLGGRRPMPPLTPPPSYLSSPARLSVKKHHSEAGSMYSRYSHSGSSSNGILHNVLPKLNLKKKSSSNSSSSLSSSSYSSSSSVSSSPWSSARSTGSTPSTPEPPRRKFAYHLRRREEDEDDEEEEGECEESPMGNLCFGIPGRNHSSKRGCSANFIKLLLKQHA